MTICPQANPLPVNAFRHAFPILCADDVERAARPSTSTLGSDEGLRAAGFGDVRPPRLEPWARRRTYSRDENGHLLHVTAKR